LLPPEEKLPEAPAPVIRLMIAEPWLQPWIFFRSRPVTRVISSRAGVRVSLHALSVKTLASPWLLSGVLPPVGSQAARMLVLGM
jgi:hypothetical protein